MTEHCPTFDTTQSVLGAAVVAATPVSVGHGARELTGEELGLISGGFVRWPDPPPGRVYVEKLLSIIANEAKNAWNRITFFH